MIVCWERLQVFDRLTSDFRELLKQFDGSICPLCAVVKRRERHEIERVIGDARTSRPLCGNHLEIILAEIPDSLAKARRVRGAIEASLTDTGGECYLCARLARSESRLVRAIRRLDGSMRFRKALEAAPVFCRRHVMAVVDGDCAPDFGQVERAKLMHLRDALAQAELKNAEDLESLIARGIAYLAPGVEKTPPVNDEDSADCSEAQVAEFEHWDQARLFGRLSALESEVASLRYRNAVLSEDNRRLKLAQTAGEAIRRDLERDRKELLAAVGAGKSSKPPSQD